MTEISWYFIHFTSGVNKRMITNANLNRAMLIVHLRPIYYDMVNQRCTSVGDSSGVID